MVMIGLCSLLIGAVLGTRLRVKALFPAVVLGLVLVTAASAFKGSGAISALIGAAVWTVSLQFGYLGGLLSRYSMAASRLPLHRSLRSPIARS
ncbi:MAG TPA: hypothetical protein VGF82_19715 [Terracidiphilus sp.]|jgi:hypothetical protein